MRSKIPHPMLLGTALLVSPALMLVGDLIAAVSGREGFWGATLLLWVSFYFYIGASLAMTILAGRTRLAVIGCAVAIFGCLMGTTIMGLERVGWAMLGQGISSAVVQEVLMEPTVFLTSRAPGLTFPIGLLLLTYALVRAGKLSLLAGTTLAIGTLFFPVGRIVAGPWANVAGDLLMVLILGPMGAKLLLEGSTSDSLSHGGRRG